MNYPTRSQAIAVAQRLCDADGQRRIILEYLRTDGGDGLFYIESYKIQDALFYSIRVGSAKQEVTVVKPTAGGTK